ncbi:hypothetical protein [Nannocystis pusilla]|uniref:hypothetical protein n=1 Tax=Nannocystis pusilla TaxID=889268 RepID=UPI003B76D8EA
MSRKLMALGYEATLTNVVALAVPELSDQCLVTAVAEDGAQGRTAASGSLPKRSNHCVKR